MLYNDSTLEKETAQEITKNPNYLDIHDHNERSKLLTSPSLWYKSSKFSLPSLLSLHPTAALPHLLVKNSQFQLSCPIEWAFVQWHNDNTTCLKEHQSSLDSRVSNITADAVMFFPQVGSTLALCCSFLTFQILLIPFKGCNFAFTCIHLVIIMKKNKINKENEINAV